MKEDKIKYISLHEATKFCNYSQKYLNLRINQGKLKGIKIGRNWVTTKEWIKDYIKNNNNNGHKNNNHKNGRNNKNNHYRKFILPPENLPIEISSEIVLRRITKEPSLVLAMSAIFILLTCSVFINRVGIGQTLKDGFNCFDTISNVSDKIFKESIKNISKSYDDLYQFSIIVGEGGNVFVKDSIFSIGQTLSDIKSLSIKTHKIISEDVSIKIDRTSFSVINSQKNQTSEDLFKDTLNIFNDYKNWMSENIYRFSIRIHDEFFVASLAAGEKMEKITNLSFKEDIYFEIQRLIYQFKHRLLAINDLMENKINKGVLAISQFFAKSKEIITEKKLTPTTKEGLVVIPSTEKNEEIKKKIQESFSDEVKVEIKDESSGIITPVFKEKEGEEYLYILVPINK